MPPTLTPRAALKILDQVGQNFSGNRQDHVNIQQAVLVLSGLVAREEVASSSPDATPAETADPTLEEPEVSTLTS